MNVLVVVPCYNEEKRLQQQLFLDFVQRNSHVSFLFVNDGSSDATSSVIEDLSKQSSQILYLNLEINGGKAEAVRRGMLYAAENIAADCIAFWDADLATPLEELLPMLSAMEKGNFEVVTGLRLKRLGAKVNRKSGRHYLGRVFATFASNMLKLPVYDTQCGAKIYKKELVKSLFSEKFVTKWLFDVELLARYVKNYGREETVKSIYECPLFVWDDVAGSRLKMKDFLKAPLELLKIKSKYL